jgi:hypothetical protein
MTKRSSSKLSMRSPFTLPALTIALAAATASAPLLPADIVTANATVLKVTPAAPPRARPFSPHDVRLLEGSDFKAGQDAAAKWLLSLEPDRLLANFRKEAGL